MHEAGAGVTDWDTTTCLPCGQARQAISPSNDRPLQKPKRSQHYVRLNQEFRAYLQWWRVFIERWNGVAVILSCDPPQFVVTSDASGHWGCGTWCQTSWFQFMWPETARPHHIAFKELLAVLLAAGVWGDRWYGTRVQWLCDNHAAVRVVSSRSCRDQSLIYLLRCLFFFEVRYQFQLVALHIPGVDNTLADDLSHDRLSCFLSKAPEMECHPSPIPTSLPTLLLEGGNWMCPRWTREFASIFREG